MIIKDELKIDNIFNIVESRKNRNLVLLITTFFTILLIYTLTRHTMDFIPFRGIARDVVFKGMDLYNINVDFSYPPFFFCITSFFAIFTLPVAVILWYILNISLFLGSILLSVAIVRYKEPEINANILFFKYRIPVVLIAPLLSIFILMDNLYLGQANILLLFTLCCSIYFYLRGEKTHWISGIFLSLGIAIKVTPLLFLIYFLFKREFKVIYGAILGLFLFFLVIPSGFYGIERNWELFKTWLDCVILPFLSGSDIKRGTLTYKHINQSIEGFLMRTLTDFAKNMYGGLHNYINIINLKPALVKLIANIWRLVLLIVMGTIFIGNLKSKVKLLKYEFALLILSILFISPGSWNNHFIIAFFPYAVAVRYILNKRNEKKNRSLLKNCLAAAFIFSCTGIYPYLQSFSGMFIGHFVLWIGLVVILVREGT